MSAQARAKVVNLRPQASTPDKIQALFLKLKTIRNVSIGIGLAGSGLLAKSSRTPLAPWATAAAVTVTVVSLSTAATAQLLISLNEQLVDILSQPAPPPEPGSVG